MSDIRIGIIIGSTRPGRHGEKVATWVHEKSQRRAGYAYELVDLRDFALPLLDEAMPPSMGQYEHEHTKAWASRIDSYDGFIFVTPEYNHSTSGALKNAIDYLYAEWNNKAAAFVSYGAASSGMRAVEHLRQIAAEIQIADVRQQLAFSLFTDFENWDTFVPGPQHEDAFTTMLDQLEAWTAAMQSVREEAERKAA